MRVSAVPLRYSLSRLWLLMRLVVGWLRRALRRSAASRRLRFRGARRGSASSWGLVYWREGRGLKLGCVRRGKAGAVALVVGNLHVVELLERLKGAGDGNPVARLLSTGIVREPEDAEPLQRGKVGNFREVGDKVFTEVKLLQVLAVTEGAEGGNAVDAEREHFDVRELLQHAHIRYVMTPQIERPNSTQVITLALLPYQVWL